MLSASQKRTFVGNSRIQIGRFTYGHESMVILEWGEGASLTIGAFCSIANQVSIFLGGNHRLDWITTYPFGHIFQKELGDYNIPGHPGTNGDVTIGSDVWIGNRATIMSGVSIGSGAVIAANSHVVKNIGPYEVVGGNPARTIKYRFNEKTIELLLKLCWWDLSMETIREIAPKLCSVPSEDDIRGLLEKVSK